MRRVALFFSALALLLVPCASASAQVPGLPSPLAPEPPPAGSEPENPPPAAEEPARKPAAKRRPAPSFRRLSNERSRSQWAYVVSSTYARRSPSRRGRRIKLLRTTTPDGTAEVVLALAERRKADGSRWVQVRLPMRPNNRTGWVPRSRLGRLRVVRTSLRVDRRRQRATLFRAGRAVWRSRIGVGEPQWPTPRGRFYVRSRLLPVDPGGIYGVFAFGLSAYSETLTDWPRGGMIGVHGTNQPELIPGRVSHGCIRLPNAKIARLKRLMPLGTPVQIL